MGLWFSIFPNLETVVAQALAALVVLGSCFMAEELKVRRHRRRGGLRALRARTTVSARAGGPVRGLNPEQP
jgi:high-affinity iron transporter